MLNNLEQWKTIILSLPDNDFFGIMRNYLGEIKTPFNKHILVDRLLSFLTREETIDRIMALISSQDAYLLTLIYFLDEPDIKTLYDFLKNDKSYLELQHLLLNLEERLLTFKEPDTGRIRLSPIFKDTLIQNVLDTNIVFPSEKIETENIHLPWFNEAVITAVISFINQTPDIFKLDGEIKKRPGESILQIFPSILENTETGATKFSIIIDTLISLNLLSNSKGKLLINYNNIREFSSLSAEERCSLLWSAAISPDSGIKTLSKISLVISSFLRSIPAGTGFTESNLLFFLKAVSKERDVFELIDKKAIPALTQTEVFLEHGKDLYVLNPMTKKMLSDETGEEPSLIIQSSFSITAKPWITLKSGLILAVSSCIKSFDLFAHYEITKKSCAGIRKLKITYRDLLAYFNKHGGGNVPQNIETSLEHWAEEYNTIQLYKGVMLVVSESRQVIINHIETLKPYVKLHPAPNVYILDENEQDEWSRILQEAGIPVLPEIKDFSVESGDISLFNPVHDKNQTPPKLNFIDNSSSIRKKADNSFVDELQSTLEKKNLTSGERDELRTRISRKLILFPEQIQKGIYRKEITEVGGLDYTGKIRLIHRAMDSQTDILELKSNSLPEGKNRILVRPVKIENTDNKHLLIARILPEEEEIEIPVGKLSFVRLLKSSLYTPVSGSVSG